MTRRIGTLVRVRDRGSIKAVGVVLFLTVAAACSSSGDKAAPVFFIEQSTALANGDAICKQLNTDVSQMISAFRTAHSNLTQDEARTFLTESLFPRIDRGDGDLHRLGEPTKERVGFDEAILAFDRDVSALKTTAQGDAVKLLTSNIVLYDKSAKPFSDWGFKECGKNPT